MNRYQKIAVEVYKAVGGNKNVASHAHCMTRLRIAIVDSSKVDLDAIKAIDGVINVVEVDTLQIILGPGVVNKVSEQFGLIVDEANENFGDITEEIAVKSAAIRAEDKQKNDTIFKRLQKWMR